MILPITSGKADIFLIINNKREISIKYVRERLDYLSLLSRENITMLLYEEVNEECVAIKYIRTMITELCQLINE